MKDEAKAKVPLSQKSAFRFPASLVQFTSSRSRTPAVLSPTIAVAVDAFTPVKSTLSGLPVHVAPLPAGSILVSR
jgi:hypothetical protein